MWSWLPGASWKLSSLGLGNCVEGRPQNRRSLPPPSPQRWASPASGVLPALFSACSFLSLWFCPLLRADLGGAGLVGEGLGLGQESLGAASSLPALLCRRHTDGDEPCGVGIQHRHRAQPSMGGKARTLSQKPGFTSRPHHSLVGDLGCVTTSVCRRFPALCLLMVLTDGLDNVTW